MRRQILERFRPIYLAFVVILILLVIGVENRQFFNRRFETEYSTTTSVVASVDASPVDAIRVLTKETHKATVIWLHGLEETGEDWRYLSSYFNFTNVKWIFPHAPTINVTGQGGRPWPGWFDIWRYEEFWTRDDEERLLKSANAVHRFVLEEVKAGIDSDKIVIGGFSQGCVIAILAGYTCQTKLGGIIGLSGWLPLHHKFPAMQSKANLKTPMLQIHGTEDETVTLELAKMSYLTLKEMGVNVEFHEMEGRKHHFKDPETLGMIGKWLKERLDI